MINFSKQYRRFSSVIFLFVVMAAFSAAKDNTKQLATRYREWLTKDVAYIISNQEKDAFLQLPSDQARDGFIERFWELRNPTPSSPDNTYRSEHYRRIQYASDYFGHASHTEGWRTPMGQVYITLGEPAQRQKLLGLQKVTPMEIWFYSNANPALPPFFYVIFYQREITDEFRLYSPSSDGPEKLITSVVGAQRSEALKIISQDAGRDVARETLSLIPNEPVDLESGTVSLMSDVMLGTIKNLANNPISQAELANRKRILEDVSHKIVLGSDYLDVLTVPLRDREGNVNLHYVLRLTKPEDFSLGRSQNGAYYYSVLASARVLTPDGKLVLTEEKKLTKVVTPDQFEAIKGKLFGYEGWLPIPPNKYKLEFQLTNLISNTAFHREVEVEVPDVNSAGLQISNIVPFSQASMLRRGEELASPFSGGGVKFLPLTGQELRLRAGEPLNFFYQVWDSAALRENGPKEKLIVDYAYGRMGARDTQSVHDEVSLDQLDPGGSIINGKRIPTTELSPGNYRLVMTLRNPANEGKVYGSLTFSITSIGSATDAWDITDDGLTEAIKGGIPEYQRASGYLALGDQEPALKWFQRANSKNPADSRVLAKLVELYFGMQQYAKIAALYASGVVDQSTDEQTVLRIAQSFDKIDNTTRAIALMENGTRLNPSSAPLFLELANLYRKAGDSAKAAAAEQHARALADSIPHS